ncbi:MAG: ERCC4 domain-containing protein [Candidatus Micrarchaeia archaeon]
MPEKAIIVVDIREPDEHISFLRALNIDVQIQTLSVGDFILSERVAAERKTRADFQASVIDGRLFEQMKRLTQAYPRVVLIVEGTSNEQRLSRPALLGAYSSLIAEYGVSLFFCHDAKATAEILASMAKYEQISKKCALRINAKQKANTPAQEQLALIEALPKTGPALAKNMLLHFKTPMNIFNATQKELEEVGLIGAKRAKLIRNLLDSVYK